MPVSLRHPLRRLSQQEFGEIAFEVMRHVFEIHNDIGRFFNERFYKQELSNRMPGVRLEEPVDVAFGSFQSTLFVDAIFGDGAIFEFKAVEVLGPSHRAQLLTYLLLCDAAHGKLVNMRREDVEHEFINTQWTSVGRRAFEIDSVRWQNSGAAESRLQDFLIALLRDLGTGLEISLYEEAIAHHFVQPADGTDVAVVFNSRRLGDQRLRLISPDVAVKITSFERRFDEFELHAARLLTCVDVRAIAWVNITLKKVTFTMLRQ